MDAFSSNNQMIRGQLFVAPEPIPLLQSVKVPSHSLLRDVFLVLHFDHKSYIKKGIFFSMPQVKIVMTVRFIKFLINKWVVTIFSFPAPPQSHGPIYAEVAPVSTCLTPAAPKAQVAPTEYSTVAFTPKVEDNDSD